MLITEMSTPKSSKHTLSPKSVFSPVVLPESPAASTSQRNLTGLPRVARDCAADIYNNIQQWNSMHVRGATIIKEISLLKLDSKVLYPEGLEPLSTSMYEVINALKIIISNLEICAQQLKSLVNLHKSSAPLFISWSVAKMTSVGDNIYKAYKQEVQLKEFLVDNICHVQGKDKLMFYAACWTYQPYITPETKLQLESLLTETGHRNKT